MPGKSSVTSSWIALGLALVVNTPALPQGSTGGAIGKTGKSASGGEEATPQARAPSRGQTAIVNVAGRWRWQVTCPVGHWTGDLALAQGGTGFSGSLTVPGEGTQRVSDGRVTGNAISFLRAHPTGQQTWSGTIVGASMSGSLTTGIGINCTWSASR